MDNQRIEERNVNPPIWSPAKERVVAQDGYVRERTDYGWAGVLPGIDTEIAEMLVGGAARRLNTRKLPPEVNP